jgi:hypothetical protein
MAVIDDFNRADGAIGADWTNQTGPGFVVSSNSCVPSGGVTVHLAHWATGTNTFDDNQSAEAQLSLGSAAYVGVSVRMTGTGATTSGYYLAYGPGGFGFVLRRMDNFADTDLDSDTSVVLANGDSMKLEVSGTSLIGTHNGVTKVTATDATYASGQPGIYGFEIAPGGIDIWIATGETGGGAAPTNHHFTLLGVGG